MVYDFDKVVNRRDTYSIKYSPESRNKPTDVLPMWVADMDIASPPEVVEALKKSAEHGIFGYSEPDAAYHESVFNWYSRRFNWEVKKEWLTITPGVVNALYLAVRAFTNEGDYVLIQQPVYYPFEGAIKHTGRKKLVNKLNLENGRYVINFTDFEEKIKQAKLFILCNPHNPVGRVWTKDELIKMGEICLRYNVKVVADEIWQDFIYKGHEHIVFASLSPQLADITLTATSPSKTFNLAGLQHANIFTSNELLRRKFVHEYNSCGLSQPSLMGLISCKAAYDHGEAWLEQLITYLENNIDFIDSYFKGNLPQLKAIKSEGTYVKWFDFRELNITQERLNDLITNEAKLWLSDGAIFGETGEGFQRMNIACPKSTITEAVNRLHKALELCKD